MDAPSLKARQTQVRAARSAADAADALPDPTLDLSLQNVPVSGPDALSLGADFMTMETIGISQDFPNPAKRHARLGRAEADIAAAEAKVAVEARSVRVATALAWTDLYFAEHRLAILDLLDDSIEALAGPVVARLTSRSPGRCTGRRRDRHRTDLSARRSDSP